MREVLGVARDAGRLLAAHWPVLLMWFAAGSLIRFLALELAGTVGTFSAVGGILLLPLAALARLVALVAMLLVLRDGMGQLRAIAPLPEGKVDRRRSFVDGLLGGILPFFAFYAAWGFLKEDAARYTTVALDLKNDLDLTAWGECLAQTTQVAECSGVNAGLGSVDAIGLNALTIGLIIAAFALRWGWKRWRTRLPKAFAFMAVYVEALWVYLSVYVISDVIGMVTTWIEQRQAMVWLSDLRSWVNSQVALVAWIWDGVEWFIGEAGGIILLPVAWLTIAGVVYGQAVVAQAPRLAGGATDRVLSRFARVPSWIRRRAKEFGAQMVALFRPVWSALVLMWRAGPVIIGAYVLFYVAIVASEDLLLAGIVRAIGPHTYEGFWAFVSLAAAMLVAIIVEPVRVSLIASAYDTTIGQLRSRAAAIGSEDDVEVKDASVRERGQRNSDRELSLGVHGDHEVQDEGLSRG